MQREMMALYFSAAFSFASALCCGDPPDILIVVIFVSLCGWVCVWC